MQDQQSGGGQPSLEDIDRIRRRVINVIGHELRTPITTMRGLAEGLLEADETEIRRRLAPAITRSARRLESLLDDLLVAAGVTTAIPLGEAEDVDLAALARKVWEELGGRPDDVGGADRCVVHVTPVLAERILHHLCSNALQYGHDPMSVVVGEDGWLEIRSRSTDVGADELDLAFELFYRGEPAVMAAPGMGLGLPVSRELARLFDGDVTVRVDGDVVVARLELPQQ